MPTMETFWNSAGKTGENETIRKTRSEYHSMLTMST